MNSADFEDLNDHFINKVSDLQKLVQINLAVKDDCDCREYLEEFQSDLENLQSGMADLKLQLQETREALGKLQETNKKMDKLITHLKFTRANIPERLPKQHDSEATDSTNGNTNQSNQKPSSQTAPPTATVNQSATGKQPSTYYPEIEYIKVHEFKEVPKYLKGRLTYDQVNKFIEGMNTAYVSKYKLLKQKKSSLNDKNRKRYENYKGQETKDTAGCYFVTDEDLKDFGGLKLDSVGRSIQTILRHCKRVREVRGGKLTRIVYIDSY